MATVFISKVFTPEEKKVMFDTFERDIEVLRCYSLRKITAIGLIRRRIDPNGHHYTASVNGERRVIFTREEGASVATCFLPVCYIRANAPDPRGLNKDGYG